MRIHFMVAGFVLCSCVPVLAQETPSLDVSGGYTFLRDQDLKENFHGWVGSIARNVSQSLAIVGEVGGSYKTLEVFGTDVDLSVHTFAGGPRVIFRRLGRVTPFAQLLLGAARAGGASKGAESTVDFALQPGGGIDFWLSPNFGIRVGGDYRRIFAETEGTNEFRLQIGAVFGIGSR